MNKYTLLALSVAGGILSALAWTDWCPGLILLISFTPFLLIENYLFENRNRYPATSFFTYLLPGFVIFCILTLNWIRVVSIFAAVCVILTASFLMTFTMWLAHIIRLKAGSLPWYISLVSFWLTLEFICLRINILSPWVNLGNGFSKDILFIQWYEVTGTGGGTLWILASNLIFSMLLVKLFKNERKKTVLFLVWLAVIIFPSAISLLLYISVKPSLYNKNEVVIVQPDIDPYTEKFTLPFDIQLTKALNLAGTAITPNTAWVVLPETTIDDPVDENNLVQNKYIKSIKGFTEKYPGLSVVTGIVSFRSDDSLSGVPSFKTEGSVKSPLFRNYYNSAFKIDSGDAIEIYHKSKLVPGFETQFSAGLLKLLAKLLPDIGGTKWGYQGQKERTCFSGQGKSLIIAPVICYESVFGEFVTGYVKNGAEAIFVITNDGWWKNTSGYKQHFSYSSLRAIETRRPVVRSANTGISCIIDIKGKVIEKSEWWVPATLRGTICPETRITPYVRYGDYLMRFGCMISVMIALSLFVYRPVRNKTSHFGIKNVTII